MFKSNKITYLIVNTFYLVHFFVGQINLVSSQEANVINNSQNTILNNNNNEKKLSDKVLSDIVNKANQNTNIFFGVLGNVYGINDELFDQINLLISGQVDFAKRPPIQPSSSTVAAYNFDCNYYIKVFQEKLSLSPEEIKIINDGCSFKICSSKARAYYAFVLQELLKLRHY